MALSLADVIALIESNDNPAALRFDSIAFEKVGGSYGPSSTFRGEVLGRIMAHNRCDDTTARAIYAMSWGAFRQSGFRLYDTFDCRHSIAAVLINPLLQRSLFDGWCIRESIAYAIDELRGASDAAATKRRTFALRFNAAGSIDAYADKIAEMIERLSGATVTSPQPPAAYNGAAQAS